MVFKIFAAIGLSLETNDGWTEQILVYITLMLTDCQTAENLSIVPLQISAQLGNYSIQGLQPMTLMRPTDEVMDINTTVEVNNPDLG